MKHYFLILALALSACAGNGDHVAPTAEPTRAAVTHAQNSVLDAQTSAASAISNIAKLELVTAARPEEHKIALAVHSDLDSLTKHLLSTQRDLLDAQQKLALHQFDVQKQTDTLNKTEKKTKSPISILGVVGLVLSFISNPFSFLVTRAVELLVGLIVCLALFIGARFAIRRYRKSHP